MTSPLPRGAAPSRGLRLAAAGLCSLLVLTACSGGDDEPESGSAAAASASASAYPEVPEGVELTDPGEELALGDAAVVAWEPRADTVGALSLTPQSFEKDTMRAFAGWKLDESTRRSTPYYVHVSVENVGETDLGGLPVPLYIVDAADTLIQQSTFQSAFAPCASTTLPQRFPAGAKTEMCLVYLAPSRGVLEAASFRPTQAFDPITWTGEVTDAEPPRKARREGGRKRGPQDRKRG